MRPCQRLEVIDRTSHVTQRAHDLVVKSLSLRGRQQSVEVIVLHRLSDLGSPGGGDLYQVAVLIAHRSDDRVDDMGHRDIEALNGTDHRIDEKGSIQRGYLNDCSRRRVSVVLV